MNNNDITHTPVMLNEVMEWLQPKPGQLIVDATFGDGGHTQAILADGAKVVAIDQDEEAIRQGQARIFSPGLTLVHDNFLNLAKILHQLSIETIDGILFDLGTSARQLEMAGRGFSFMRDEPLDMRMDKSLAVAAKDLVNGLGRKELSELFTKLAQEERARSIADAIVRARSLSPIETTGQLARLIAGVYAGRQGKLHPATKAFQALRIAVNDELNNLRAVLPQAATLLTGGGRLVVISFHEGEDRIVKQFIRNEGDKYQLTNNTKKPVVPTQIEIINNPRARSAKLRAATKTI